MNLPLWFLDHKVLKVAKVESMRRLQRMKLVVKNSKMKLRDNLVEFQFRDQKLLRLFQP